MKKIFFILGLVFIGVACNSKDDNPRPTKPEIAKLLFPEKDQTCTQGIIINKNTSAITFEWEPNEGADSFTLTVRNLLSDRIESYTSTETFKEVTLSRNTPYSWFVISINTKSGDSTTSNLWKFYNAGEGVVTYPPFPAELLTPKSGSTTYSTTNIELTWNGTDVDNDISEYELILDTINPPTTKWVGGLTNETYTLAPLAPKVYYWYVNTLDKAGNSTPSSVGQFRIQ